MPRHIAAEAEDQPREEPARDEPAREDPPRGGGGRGINHITLVGRLARDPDVRVTGEGVPRAWFVLAVPRAFPSRDGEREADFISIVAWRQLATVIGEHLTKGRLIGLTGRLQVSTLESGDGSRRTSTEVVADGVAFLDAPRRPSGEEASAEGGT